MCIISEEGLHILFLAEHPNLHIHSKVKFQTGLGALKRDLNNISKECEMYSFYYIKAPLRVACVVVNHFVSSRFYTKVNNFLGKKDCQKRGAFTVIKYITRTLFFLTGREEQTQI
jgi:hypothetical protein